MLKICLGDLCSLWGFSTALGTLVALPVCDIRVRSCSCYERVVLDAEGRCVIVNAFIGGEMGGLVDLYVESVAPV